MRPVLFLFQIVLCLTLKAQKSKEILYVDKAYDQLIFIDTPHSKFHHLVFEKLLAGFQSDLNNYLMDEISNHILSNYQTQWITLNKYNHRYYAYCPSEAFFNTFLSINESVVIINDFNEGFVAYSIVRKNQAKRITKYELVDLNGKHHFLSLKKKHGKLFVAQSSLFCVNRVYFVQRQYFFNYPIIVNYCPNSRCREFNFK